MPRAELGQHFLASREVAEKIVGNFLPVGGEILEIGPGKGILTEILCREHRSRPITVVELDEYLAQNLIDVYGNRLRVLRQNILDTNLETLYPNQTVSIIGNIPYYISKALIDWVITNTIHIDKGLFMVQKEFSDKLLGGKSSAQALMLAGCYVIRKLFDVRPGSFSPPPRVVSTVFTFRRIEPQTYIRDSREDFYRFLKWSFANPRKTLLNNLAAVLGRPNALNLLKHSHIDLKSRAEDLTLRDFLDIFAEISEELKRFET